MEPPPWKWHLQGRAGQSQAKQGHVDQLPCRVINANQTLKRSLMTMRRSMNIEDDPGEREDATGGCAHTWTPEIVFQFNFWLLSKGGIRGRG